LAPTIFPVLGFDSYAAGRAEDDGNQRGAEKFVELWEILDRQLSRHEFVAGDSLPLADIVMANSIHGWYAFPIERPDFKNLKMRFDRISLRPAFKSTSGSLKRPNVRRAVPKWS
jgi:glutathione S-transferase